MIDFIIQLSYFIYYEWKIKRNRIAKFRINTSAQPSWPSQIPGRASKGETKAIRDADSRQTKFKRQQIKRETTWFNSLGIQEVSPLVGQDAYEICDRVKDNSVKNIKNEQTYLQMIW